MKDILTLVLCSAHMRLNFSVSVISLKFLISFIKVSYKDDEMKRTIKILIDPELNSIKLSENIKNCIMSLILHKITFFLLFSIDITQYIYVTLLKESEN